jgi:hypothetical protein
MAISGSSGEPDQDRSRRSWHNSGHIGRRGFASSGCPWGAGGAYRRGVRPEGREGGGERGVADRQSRRSLPPCCWATIRYRSFVTSASSARVSPASRKAPCRMLSPMPPRAPAITPDASPIGRIERCSLNTSRVRPPLFAPEPQPPASSGSPPSAGGARKRLRAAQRTFARTPAGPRPPDQGRERLWRICPGVGSRPAVEDFSTATEQRRRSDALQCPLQPGADLAPTTANDR